MFHKSHILVASAVVLLVADFCLPEFWLTLSNYVGLSAIVVLGLVLLTGISGLSSFGQAAFVGVGAYATAYLTTAWGFSPWLTLFIALGLTGILALVIGGITFQLSGHYLPLSTMAWGLSLYYLFGNLEMLGGHTGISDIPPLRIASYAIDSSALFGLIIWGSVLLTCLLLFNLLDSRAGRAMRALNGGAAMAESFGISTRRSKIIAFVISAVLASLSGWLYAHFLRFVNPTPFNIGAGVEYLFIAVVGGAAFLSGAIVGSAVLVLLKELLQEMLPGLIGTAGNYELIAFGVIMILLLQRTQQGIMNVLAPLLSPLARGDDELSGTSGLPARTPPVAGTPLLRVEHITKRFGGLVAVDDLSFTLRAGEILGLVGPNGAGKSTTFAVVSGTLAPSSGSIRLLDNDISASPSRRIAQLGVARTFQHVRLLPEMTVVDNVMLGMHLRGSCGLLAGALQLDRAEEACLRAEAMHQIERVGLSGHANEPAGNLSMGHQRLVEIARALAADPILLLVDEPAAGLRQFEKDALSALFAQVRKDGISIILVEHDMDFLMNLANRLVVINFGRKIAEGRPDEISSHPDVLEAYLGGIYDDEERAA